MCSADETSNALGEHQSIIIIIIVRCETEAIPEHPVFLSRSNIEFRSARTYKNIYQ
jgi:hypothetical protein